MATTRYTVMYQYTHPLTKKPVTNRQTGYKSFSSVQVNTVGTRDYSPTVTLKYPGEVKLTELNEEKVVEVKPGQPDVINDALKEQKEFIANRNYPTSDLFDMLFCFDNAKTSTALSNSKFSVDITADSFIQAKGKPWFVYSIHGSLESALQAAGPLVKRIGKDSVRIFKDVPVSVTVGIE